MDNPEYVTIPKFREYSGDSVYADVLSHSKDRPFGDAHGRPTNVHETAHGIHSYLRNTTSGRTNGFYCDDGNGAVILEPNMRKRHVAEFVPSVLQGYRYSLYITGQVAWDDSPLYVYDEWAAYILGGMTHLDDIRQGKHNGEWSDGVSGCLEFAIYGIAVCMAVVKHDPEYWNDEQFRLITLDLLWRSYRTFMEGREESLLKWDKQDALYDEMMMSDEAASVRRFLIDYFGGVWLSYTEPTEYTRIQSGGPNDPATPLARI